MYLANGGMEVVFEKFEEMTYAKYVAYAKKFILDGKSFEDIEDNFWDMKPTTAKYAINNEISLFGDDVKLWNLSRFTNAESNLHASPYYRSVIKNWVSGVEPQMNKVCLFYY